MSVQNNNNSNIRFIAKNTIFRLVKDVKDINNNPLHSDGIFYKHDSENFLIGRAMLIGPKDTPYEGCPMLFRFNFPESYPHDPPKATFLTGDGNTRFHPNYYKCGKVCLSILNTWSGEKWSGCQTITSILLTMYSILTDNPLIHEPGMSGQTQTAEDYKKMVDYSCKRKIIDFLENRFSQEFEPFYSDYINYIKENKQQLLKIYEEKEKTCNLETLNSPTYSFQTKVEYNKLNSKFKRVLENIE
jgi:ubiquitin-conjugating enzyme E2 Z